MWTMMFLGCEWESELANEFSNCNFFPLEIQTWLVSLLLLSDIHFVFTSDHCPSIRRSCVVQSSNNSP